MSVQVTGIAISYLRFSTPEQSRGDSLRRQNALRDDWLARHPHIRLDTDLTLEDKGVSGFTGEHRNNPDRYALAALLKLVENGVRVKPGTHLIVESLDRLTREDTLPALSLALNLIQAGIIIVQLLPVEMVYDKNASPFQLMMMIMELSRGHSESAMKAERVGGAWHEKRTRARKGEKQKETKRMGDNSLVLTARLPAWLELKDGKPVPIPERKVAVQRIFTLAANGHGYTSIIQKLAEEGIKHFGEHEVKEGKKRSQFAGRWTLPYIARILSDRRVLGEYQPRTKKKQPDGDPIPNYYPPVVTPDEFKAAHAGIALRRKGGGRVKGRISKHVNIFVGLLINARNHDDTYVAAYKGNQPVYVSALSNEGQGPAYSFTIEIFDTAILRCLRELDPTTILDTKPDPTHLLRGQREAIASKIEKLSAELEEGDIPAIARVIRKLTDELKVIDAKLEEAELAAINPVESRWRDMKELLDVMSTAADKRDIRIRLRAALRAIIDRIYVLVVPHGRDRLCAVQVVFAAGGMCREYLIVYRGNRWKDKRTAILSGRECMSDAFGLHDPNQVEAMIFLLENYPKANIESMLMMHEFVYEYEPETDKDWDEVCDDVESADEC